MSKTKHAHPKAPALTLKEQVLVVLKARGYTSMLHACREKKINYQILQRAVRVGIPPGTQKKTLELLSDLGILTLIEGAHSRAV